MPQVTCQPVEWRGMRILLICLVLLLCVSCDGTKKISDIPGANTKTKIQDIGEKESVWAPPWVMWVDSSGDCYINDENEFSVERQDKDWIKLTKSGSGYIVDICGSSFKWSKGTTQGSTGEKQCKAVVEFKNTPDPVQSKVEK